MRDPRREPGPRDRRPPGPAGGYDYFGNGGGHAGKSRAASGYAARVPSGVGKRRRRRGSAAGWLMVIPIAATLATPMVNREHPVLWGMPFFYWYQLACAGIATVVITLVYRLRGGRD